MTKSVHKGQCMCGAVRIEATGDPLWTATCHCADCRRATGAVVSAFAGYQADKANIKGESFSEYESSPGVFRGYCATCGGRLTYRAKRWPGEIHFHVGAFDQPEAFAPKINVMTKDRVGWVELEARLPAFQTVPSDKKD